jgi:putative SOS response-associated peptidase YedK
VTAHVGKPGVVQVPEDGKKTVYVTVGVWLRDDGQIQISFGEKGITTVSNNPESKRYHEKMYHILRDILKEADRWSPVSSSGYPGREKE